jgi:hypothetical protein
MSDVGEEDPTLFHEGEEESLASLGIYYNAELHLEDLKNASTKYASARKFDLI